jgi:hypothetical protein
MTLFMIKAILMSFLPFYRVDFPVELFPKEITYVEYDHGREVGRITLNEKEGSYIVLKELFIKNRNGWRYDLTTYAPGHLFISSKMKINCLNDGALVVNYEDKSSDWIQISKKDGVDSCPTVALNGSNNNK